MTITNSKVMIWDTFEDSTGKKQKAKIPAGSFRMTLSDDKISVKFNDMQCETDYENVIAHVRYFDDFIFSIQRGGPDPSGSFYKNSLQLNSTHLVPNIDLEIDGDGYFGGIGNLLLNAALGALVDALGALTVEGLIKGGYLILSDLFESSELETAAIAEEGETIKYDTQPVVQGYRDLSENMGIKPDKINRISVTTDDGVESFDIFGKDDEYLYDLNGTKIEYNLEENTINNRPIIDGVNTLRDTPRLYNGDDTLLVLNTEDEPVIVSHISQDKTVYGFLDIDNPRISALGKIDDIGNFTSEYDNLADNSLHKTMGKNFMEKIKIEFSDSGEITEYSKYTSTNEFRILGFGEQSQLIVHDIEKEEFLDIKQADSIKNYFEKVGLSDEKIKSLPKIIKTNTFDEDIVSYSDGSSEPIYGITSEGDVIIRTQNLFAGNVNASLNFITSNTTTLNIQNDFGEILGKELFPSVDMTPEELEEEARRFNVVEDLPLNISVIENDKLFVQSVIKNLSKIRVPFYTACVVGMTLGFSKIPGYVKDKIKNEEYSKFPSLDEFGHLVKTV
ncbi:hypothetical protein V1503_23515 [Bacillus sp. SCS-151]|uniref:hypothetical protein n=1 Tax=Nanhaiella sioensis TaxID=3115293 RepID=UPI00397ACAC1